MAGTVDFTYIDSKDKITYPVSQITFSWVASAGGAVSGILSELINGTIVKVVFNPGSPTPSAAYDVTLLDDNGLDVLAGQGANLSETTTTAVCPGIPFKDGTTTGVVEVAINSKLELQVANAGSGGAGAVIVYVRALA